MPAQRQALNVACNVMSVLIPEIEKEIEVRRLKPEYLITIFEQYFKNVDDSYPTSLKDILTYRKRFKSFFREQQNFGKSIKRSAELAERVAKNSEKTLENIRKGKNVSKYSKELNEITSQIKSETDLINTHNFDRKEFHQLILLREDFLYKNKLGNTAVSSLIQSDIFDFLIKVFVFTISFVLAFSLGDYVENKLIILGVVFSKLIPALIFFLIIDKVIKWLEEKFLWNRVKYLFKKVKELNQIEEQRNFFLNNFTEK